MQFHVHAIWDEEAKVFFSNSDIVGLHIEAPTLEEFEATMKALAPEMVLENHVSKHDLSSKSFLDLIPAIYFERPSDSAGVVPA